MPLIILCGCKPPKFISKISGKIDQIEEIKARSYVKRNRPTDIYQDDFIKGDYNVLSQSIEILGKSNKKLNAEKISNPKLYSLLPRNADEYEAIYNKTPTTTIIKNIDNYNSMVNKIDSVKIISKNRSIEDLIIDSENSPIVIFGHSIEKGKILISPNGIKISAKEIHEKCINYNKNCLILTCNGNDFTIKGKISAIDGLSIWEKALDDVNTHMTTEDLVNIFSIHRGALKTRKSIYISFSISTGAASTYILSSKYKKTKFKKINLEKLQKSS